MAGFYNKITNLIDEKNYYLKLRASRALETFFSECWTYAVYRENPDSYKSVSSIRLIPELQKGFGSCWLCNHKKKVKFWRATRFQAEGL